MASKPFFDHGRSSPTQESLGLIQAYVWSTKSIRSLCTFHSTDKTPSYVCNDICNFGSASPGPVNDGADSGQLCQTLPPFAERHQFEHDIEIESSSVLASQIMLASVNVWCTLAAIDPRFPSSTRRSRLSGLSGLIMGRHCEKPSIEILGHWFDSLL